MALIEGLGGLSGAGEVIAWTGSGGVALLVMRQLYKMFRIELKEVKDSDNRESLISQYRDLAERYKKEADENGARADQFANERNSAIEEMGKLRGEVISLTRQVEHLQVQIVQLTHTIEILNKLVVQPVEVDKT